MQCLRRLIAWSFFVAFLAAVGLVVYLYVRYTPRYITEGRVTVQHLSADGRWLITSAPHPNFNVWENPEMPESEQNNRAFLDVWDTRSGQLKRRIDVGLPLEKSPDGRHFLCCREKGKLLLIDWQSTKSMEIPAEWARKRLDVKFSPKGHWLVKERNNDVWERDWPVLNVASGQSLPRNDRPFLGFINDERYAVCCADKHRLDVIDLANGRLVRSLNCDIDVLAAPCSMLVSPNGKWLVFGRAAPEHAWDPLEPGETSPATYCSAEVWDWAGGRRRLQFDERYGQSFRLIFAQNARRLATWRTTSSDYQLAIFDMETDAPPFRQMLEQSSRIVTNQNNTISVEHSSGMLSPDSDLFLFCSLNGKKNKATMFDVVAGQILWEKVFYTGSFSRDGARVGCRHFDSQSVVEVFDARSGQLQHQFPTDVQLSAVVDIETFRRGRATFNGRPRHGQTSRPWERCLEKQWPRIFGASRDCVLVADPSSGREYFRCYGGFFLPLLSEDGGTLVAHVPQSWDEEGTLAETRICAWDVHPYRAWFWAVTSSSATGVALLLIRRWRSKCKAARTTPSVVATAPPL